MLTFEDGGAILTPKTPAIHFSGEERAPWPAICVSSHGDLCFCLSDNDALLPHCRIDVNIFPILSDLMHGLLVAQYGTTIRRL